MGPLFHDLTVLGQTVINPQVLRYLEDAERHPPEFISHDASAQRSDTLQTSEGWRKLLELGAKEGCIAEGYDGPLGRMGQFARCTISVHLRVAFPLRITLSANKVTTGIISSAPPPG